MPLKRPRKASIDQGVAPVCVHLALDEEKRFQAA
jgi:hypothetical protein